MKVSQSFPNFIQGVSQQPPSLRLASHCEELINGYASAEEGLTKRPHTEYVAKLSDTPGSEARLHSFNKDQDEQGYVVLLGDGTIGVKNFDGTAATVNMVAASTYIDGVADPANDFELVTVADYTFIVNRTVTPAMKADLYHIGLRSSAVWVRTAQLETPYTITLTGGTPPAPATYNPASTAANANTVKIATELASQIHTLGTTPFNVERIGSVLFIDRDNDPYDITVQDGRGNEALVLLDRKTNNPGNLPPVAPDRFQVEILGDISTEWDNYFVEWSATSSAWLEIPEPARQYQIDPATMPHAVRYVSPGVYSFEQIDWNDCLAGDTTTNPVPSFIGKVIQDLFFYRGRLGFITDKTVVMSEAGNLFNFWRTTTTTLLDSDPIDSKVSMTNPAPLRWAVEWNDTVFFFSEKQQYYIEKNVEVLAMRTFAVRSPTSYEMDILCQPVVVGDRIYYARKRAIHASLHDYFPKADGEGKLTYGSDEVTKHAPRYIGGRIRQLRGNDGGNSIAIITDTDQGWGSHIYVFQTAFDNSNARVQAAIHRWRFSFASSVVGVECIGSNIYLLVSRNDGTFLEKCDLSPRAVDPGMPIKLLLDHRLDETNVTVTYDAGTDVSTIELPFDELYWQDPYVMYGRDGCTLALPGEKINATPYDASPASLQVDGDWTAEPFYIGKPYTFTLTLSPVVLRDQRTGAPITGGRLQLARMFLNYGDTGYFRVVVTPGGRSTFTYPLSGYMLGASTTLLGEVPMLSGTFKVPVMANAANVTVQIISDAPFPLKLLNGDWEGQFGSQSVQAARRL